LTGKITVIGEHGEKIGETFPRRAKQLVRSGRAEWAGGETETLRVFDGPAAEKREQPLPTEGSRSREGSEMQEAVTNGGRAGGGYVVVEADKAAAKRANADDFTGGAAADLDAAAMSLARRKLAARRKANRYALAVGAVIFSFWLLSALGNASHRYDTETVAGFYVLGAVCSIIVRYAKYFYDHSIRRKSRSRAESPLMREYEKLRRLPPEDLRDGMRRLGGGAEEIQL